MTVFDPPGPAVVVLAAGAGVPVAGLTADAGVEFAEFVRAVEFGPAVFPAPFAAGVPPAAGG